MILRVTFFALMALGLLGLGFIAYASTRPAHEAADAPPPPAMVHVLTAAKEISAGNLLKPGDLATKEVPTTAVPTGATMDNEDERRGLIGAMMRRSLAAGETIRLTDALRPGDHGFLAAVLKGDMRAVTVAIDATTGTAGLIAHLHARDTTLVQVSRAPIEKIERYKAKKGWAFPWYSSHGSDFNYDFHVTQDERVAPLEYNYRSKAEHEAAGTGYYLAGDQPIESPGLSAFLRDGDDVFHTYSNFARGGEMTGGSYYFLDLTALGRQEDWEEPKDRAASARRAQPDRRRIRRTIRTR